MKRVILPIHKRATEFLVNRTADQREDDLDHGIGGMLAEAIRDETIPVERLRFDEASQFYFVTVDVDWSSPLSS